MRKALNQFDRIVGPLAEACGDGRRPRPRALRRRVGAVPARRRREISRASSEVDALRELVDHIVDANLVLRDYRQNEVMKKVTSWAAIIAVPTLDHRVLRDERAVPGSGETWGVIAATGSPSAARAACTSCSAASSGSDRGGDSPSVVGVVGTAESSVESSVGRPVRMCREAFVDELGDALGQVGQALVDVGDRLVDARLGCGHHGVDDDLHVDAVGLGHLGDGLTVAQGIPQGVFLDADRLRRGLQPDTPPGRAERAERATMTPAVVRHPLRPASSSA